MTIANLSLKTEGTESEEPSLLGDLKTLSIDICRTYTRDLAIQITVDGLRVRQHNEEEYLLKPVTQPTADASQPLAKKGLVGCLIRVSPDNSVQCSLKAAGQCMLFKYGVLSRLRNLVSGPDSGYASIEKPSNINVLIADSSALMPGLSGELLEATSKTG